MARQALADYHYNPKLPHGRTSWLGVYFGQKCFGCVIFGNGVSSARGKRWGLRDDQITEITRIALAPNHPFAVSRVIALTTRLFIPDRYPRTRLLYSYADSGQGHHGGIYQAAGWTYIGVSKRSYLRVEGTVVHPKTLYNRFGKGGQSIPWLRANVDPEASYVPQPPKHRYVKALAADLVERVRQSALPYPPRET